MNSTQEFTNLVNATVAAIGLKRVSSDEIATLVVSLAPALAKDLTSAELDQACAFVETQVNVKIEVGVGIAAGHVPWLAARKSQIQWKRWAAYTQYMRSNSMVPAVLQAMGERTDIILDYAGDPSQEGAWSRRGLVIGDVQSGKTSNYLGLFNKAADAGYKVFILLAGSNDNLRKQTQKRVDQGFVGRDSSLIMKELAQVGARNVIGVGELGVSAQSFTTVMKDFQTSLVKNIMLEIQALNSPVVFVVKKNKKILDNLGAWLEAQIKEGEDKLSTPLILLDDEADYASINTNDPDQDPTAINSAIVRLLSLFHKNSYVGFTATPFANVLIDDEAPEDLFPKDFIFALESPDNYFGPEQMFDEEKAPNFIRPLVDSSKVFPFGHKSNLRVPEIPTSLEDSILNFALVNAIRDLRGQRANHRSMLINVSRYKNVQAQVFDHVIQFVSDLKSDLMFGQPTSALKQRLKAEFHSAFADCGLDWVQVFGAIQESVDPIVVHTVNSDRRGQWDSIYDNGPVRVIAIGGDVLSRGLTLEGLSTSYFFRRSIAYDTLLQMGRWFGYRDGYQDICRLWIDPEVSSWYKFISSAISELRDDLYTMRQANLTPKEFGLAVLRHPGSILTVTAFNKQRHGRVERKVSLRNFHAETAILPDDEGKLELNFQVFKNLLGKLTAYGLPTKKGESCLWSGIAPDVAADFLESFEAHMVQPLLQDNQLADWIRSNSVECMSSWDIAIMGGTGSQMPAVSATYKRPLRTVRKSAGRIQINGTKMRLSGKSDIGIGLSDVRRAEMEADMDNQVISEQVIRKYLERPILAVYPVQPRIDVQPKVEESLDQYNGLASGNALIGLHVSLPNDLELLGRDEDTITYVVNKPWVRLQGFFTPDFDSEDDENE